MSGQVKVTFIGDSSNLKKNLKQVTKSVGETETSVGKLKNRFSSMKGPSLAFGAAIGIAQASVVKFGFSSVKAYQESEEASKKLSTNLLNVKGNTLANVKAIQKMAAALQKKGVIEDDAIIAGASQLATFNLQGKTIQKLTPKIADMVAQLKGHNATAQDMVQINNLVGKAMTGSTGALSRYGVTLTEAQKKLIKQGTEAQRAATIVEVLGQNYGKVNEALRKTPQGRITALKNKFGDLKEEVGKFVALKIFEPLVKSLDKFFDKIDNAGGPFEALQKFAKDNSKAFSVLAGVIGVGMVAAFVALGASIWTALAPIAPFIAAGVALGLVIDDLVKKNGGWEKVLAKIGPHLSTIWDSLQKFIKGDFNKGLFGFNENHGLVKFLKSVREGWDTIVLAIQMYVVPIFKDIGKMIKDDLGPALERLGLDSGFLKDSLKILAITIIAIVVGAFIAIAAIIWVVVKAVTLLTQFIGKLVDGWNWLVKNLGGAKEIFTAFKDALQILFYPLQFLKIWLDAVIDRWDSFYKILKKIGGIVGAVGGAIGKAGSTIGDTLSGKWLSGIGPGRALGGKVNAGQSYTVGEGGGPEVFTPATDGYITNARQTRNMGATYNVTMNVAKTEMTPRDLMVALKRIESLRVA